jgi:heme/copper-type cytochrome/quinol oxidase subunit 3
VAADLPPLLGSLVVVNALILVASSLTLHYGHGALEAGNRRGFRAGLGTTTLLGVVFLGGQALEYYEFLVHGSFTLAGGAFTTAFYGLTGLHGLRVAIGVVLLGITSGVRSAGRSARSVTSRSEPSPCTGTSSTWCGSSSSWCCTSAPSSADYASPRSGATSFR